MLSRGANTILKKKKVGKKFDPKGHVRSTKKGHELIISKINFLEILKLQKYFMAFCQSNDMQKSVN